MTTATPCECCGKPGPHPGITLLRGRTLCETCCFVWYDLGLTDPREIGELSRQWQADPKHWSQLGPIGITGKLPQ